MAVIELIKEGQRKGIWEFRQSNTDKNAAEVKNTNDGATTPMEK